MTSTQRVQAIEVQLPAHGVLDTDRYGDPIEAVKVVWRAHVCRDETLPAFGQLIVSVTAFAADHWNRTWRDPRHFVAEGIEPVDPPTWVPQPPAWFRTAVDEMATDARKEITR